jgi:putative Mn2+ efflux pump MntP
LDIAEFLREKAAQCRALADEVSDNDSASRSMLALALELDAQAVAVEAGRVTAREIEAVPDEWR